MLKDRDVAVRTSAVAALEKLGAETALECLGSHSDPVPEVQARVVQALAVLRPLRSVRLAPFAGIKLSNADRDLAEELLRSSLAKVNVTVGENADAGAQARYELRIHVKPNGAVGLKLEATLINAKLSRLGTWSSKVNSGSHSEQLRLGIPLLVDNMAVDLEWR